MYDFFRNGVLAQFHCKRHGSNTLSTLSTPSTYPPDGLLKSNETLPRQWKSLTITVQILLINDECSSMQ
jgi:hypothetical protein